MFGRFVSGEMSHHEPPHKQREASSGQKQGRSGYFHGPER